MRRQMAGGHPSANWVSDCLVDRHTCPKSLRGGAGFGRGNLLVLVLGIAPAHQGVGSLACVGETEVVESKVVELEVDGAVFYHRGQQVTVHVRLGEAGADFRREAVANGSGGADVPAGKDVVTPVACAVGVFDDEVRVAGEDVDMLAGRLKIPEHVVHFAAGGDAWGGVAHGVAEANAAGEGPMHADDDGLDGGVVAVGGEAGADPAHLLIVKAAVGGVVEGEEVDTALDPVVVRPGYGSGVVV